MAPNGRPGSRTEHHPARPESELSGGQARSVKGLRPDPPSAVDGHAAAATLAARSGEGGLVEVVW